MDGLEGFTQGHFSLGAGVHEQATVAATSLGTFGIAGALETYEGRARLGHVAPAAGAEQDGELRRNGVVRSDRHPSEERTIAAQPTVSA